VLFFDVRLFSSVLVRLLFTHDAENTQAKQNLVIKLKLAHLNLNLNTKKKKKKKKKKK